MYDLEPEAGPCAPASSVVVEPSPSLPMSPLAPPRPAAALSSPVSAFPRHDHLPMGGSGESVGGGAASFYPPSSSAPSSSSSSSHHHHHHHLHQQHLAQQPYYPHAHHHHLHHLYKHEDPAVPIATPAAALPLPSPYVTVDVGSPSKAAYGGAAAAFPAAASLASPVTTAAHVPAPPALRDVESGDTPFRPCERVVIFTAAYYVCDGVSLTIRKLRAHLRSKGVETRVVSCGPEGWSEPDVFTVPCIPLPIVNAEDNFGYSLGIKLTDEVKDQIRQFDPSIIHFTVPDFLALDALRWAKAEGIPVMGTWHSNYSDYLKFYHLELMRGTVEKYIRSFYVNMPFFVPTPYIRNKLLENGFPKSRVGIWGRGVDLQQFNPSRRSPAFRRSKGIAEDEVVILWVGRLVKEKSPDIWAEVIRRLHAEKVKFRALVVGTGSYMDHMRRLPNTECLGWLSGQALAEVYASVDVFLFPSEVETFGNVTLEALASGVPCIASAGCSGHLVYHGLNGFVVHRADVDEYHRLTKRLVTDPVLRGRLAAKARPSIRALEHGRVMDTMVSNYDGVIRDHHEKGLGDPAHRRTGDAYMTFVYYFFSLVLVVLTPTLKAYVAGIKCLQRAWAGGHCPLPTTAAAAAWASPEGLARLLPAGCAAALGRWSEAASNVLSSMTYREMRLLMVLVYFFGLYILYQTWRSALI